MTDKPSAEDYWKLRALAGEALIRKIIPVWHPSVWPGPTGSAYETWVRIVEKGENGGKPVQG